MATSNRKPLARRRVVPVKKKTTTPKPVASTVSNRKPLPRRRVVPVKKPTAQATPGVSNREPLPRRRVIPVNKPLQATPGVSNREPLPRRRVVPVKTPMNPTMGQPLNPIGKPFVNTMPEAVQDKAMQYITPGIQNGMQGYFTDSRMDNFVPQNPAPNYNSMLRSAENAARDNYLRSQELLNSRPPQTNIMSPDFQSMLQKLLSSYQNELNSGRTNPLSSKQFNNIFGGLGR